MLSDEETTEQNKTDDKVTLPFSTVSLIRSHSNINHVIDVFLTEMRNMSKSWKEENDINLFSEEIQSKFAKVIQSFQENKHGTCVKFPPSKKYMSQLVKIFVSRAEREFGMDAIRDENLIEIMTQQFTTSSSCNCDIPNPKEDCCVSFQIPDKFDCRNLTADTTNEDGVIIGIRVYPYHNDVGVRKVWEAGACLAEFFLQNHHYVKNKVVVELGAGVGLTGIAIAKLCAPKHVLMTDYTVACMDNMDYNIKLNGPYPASGLASDSNNITTVSSKGVVYEVNKHQKFKKGSFQPCDYFYFYSRITWNGHDTLKVMWTLYWRAKKTITHNQNLKLSERKIP